MIRLVPLIAGLMLLTACGNVIEETRQTAVIQSGLYVGTEYTIRTRLIEGPQGTYEDTDVLYRGQSASCVPESGNDCEKAARNLLESFTFD